MAKRPSVSWKRLEYARPATFQPAEVRGSGASAAGSLVASLLLGGAALRVAPGFESFWFGEAWSHGLSKQAEQALAMARPRFQWFVYRRVNRPALRGAPSSGR